MRRFEKAFVVSGVCCSTEESVLRKRLDAALGGDRYAFSLANGELRVDAAVEDERVLGEVRSAGFSARGKREPIPDRPFWRRYAGGFLAGIAAALTLAGIIAERMELPGPLPHMLLLAAMVLGGWKIAVKAFHAAAALVLDMNVLMVVATLGALAIGKWDEAAAVIVLFSVALMLEEYSAARTRRAIQSLITISPTRASVVRDGKECEVDAASVRPGEEIVIRPGDRIPLDGRVVGGASTVSEAPITGESAPRMKESGASVFAGSINGRGALRVKVSRRYNDTTLAHMIHLIEDAQRERAPVQRSVDRFAAIYTPAVLGVAVLTALVPPAVFHLPFTDWLYRALVLLVIACPCALVISTPVTLVSALTNAARQGILIKGGRHIESLSSVKSIAFDKTGTLTLGQPRLTDLIPLNSVAEDDLLRLVAAIERRSEHHVAGAVIAEAERRGLAFSDVGIDEFEAIPGKGVRTVIDGTAYYLGNHALCEDRGYCTRPVEQTLTRLSREGKTVVVLGKDHVPLCIVAVLDEARHHSRDVIRRIRRLGIDHMVMLSGDSMAAARQVAADVGLEHAEAGLLPEEKVAAVERLLQQYGTVAMVGDGMNDAPALARSSVGIAMGVAGTDAALDTADVVLMSDDLSKLPYALELSKAALRIVRQNIAFALVLKLVFLLLSIAGAATLWMAVLADDGAALLVIFNGLRALVYRTTR